MNSIREDTYVEPSVVLFRQFCDDWMESVKSELKPKTWAWYRSALKQWITPRFGDWPICDISRMAVKSFVDSLRVNPDLGQKFVRNVENFLHHLFEEAIDLELIAANPARKRKNKKRQVILVDDEVTPPKDDEIAKTIAMLPQTYKYLIIASALTGARRGELLGLQWDDVDLARGVIRIRRNLQRVPKNLLEEGKFKKIERLGETGLALLSPKSLKSRRQIEMGPKLIELFERMKETRNACPFVFQDEFGKAIDPDRVTKILREARKKAGVNFRFHDLRHLHSSLLVEVGANIKQAQVRLGHANASTTADIYTHVVSDEGRKLSEKVEAALPFVSETLAEAQKPTQVSGFVN